MYILFNVKTNKGLATTASPNNETTITCNAKRVGTASSTTYFRVR